MTYFYYVTITLFNFSNRYVLDDVRITLNYGNCWNLWIVCGTYVIKWSFFRWSLFFELTNFLIMLIFLITLRSRLLWYICFKYENNVTIMLHTCSSKWLIITRLLLAFMQSQISNDIRMMLFFGTFELSTKLTF